MKNYFIAVFPNEKAKSQIAQTIGRLSLVFEAQGISVNWVKPDQYNLSVLFLGKNINFIKLELLKNSQKKLMFSNFDIITGRVKVGISNKYRTLIHLSLDEGGEQMRNLVYELTSKLHLQRDQIFIPHLTLGRITKDISEEEYKNLKIDITKYNTENPSNISFTANELSFIESNLSDFKVLKKVILT